MNRYQRELNPEQCEAATHLNGPLLILAGAGSGKTRTIIYRTVFLLEQGVAHENILAVSFTNRAVREMEERVAGMLNSSGIVKKLTMSTFHALGVRILRRDIEALGYPKRFTIYDEGDQLSLLRRAMKEHRVSEKDYDPKMIRGLISNAKNEFEEPGDVRDPLLRKLYKKYDELLRVSGAVDFDDLIRLPVRLLNEHEPCLQYWAGKFRQIMIDEYQDTNQVQLLMAQKLASIHNNICVVGDDDQSIYGWRGSNVENIRQFDKSFPGAKIVKLTQNYRCSGNILEAANHVIAKSPGRYAKKLWTDQPAGEKIGMKVLLNEADEAKYIVKEVSRLRYEEGFKWSDMSIMYRTNAQSRSFEELLRRERVPYRLIGGTKFFDRKEVRDVVAYLKVIHNSDELALRRVLNYPPRKIGTTTMDRITSETKARECSFYEVCEDIENVEKIGKTQKAAISDFVSLIRKCRERITSKENLSSVAKDLIQFLRFHQLLYKEYEKLSEAKRRIENVESLVNSIAEYETGDKKTSLSDYLERITLDSTDSDRDKAGDEVTLITLHGAKGLEYPVVFLAGVEEGFMPYFRGSEGVEDLEEERRLCYVGITRAKKKLYITRADMRRRFGKTLEREPSRFLSDIPKECWVWLANKKAKLDLSEGQKDQLFKNFFTDMQSMLNKK